MKTDDGSTLLLTIFYAALGLTVVLLVVAATSLYLERKRLFTLADGAALVGAEAFDLTDAGPQGVELQSDKVAEAVDDYLRRAPQGFDALEVEQAGSVDGQSATVTLSSRWSPPVLSALVPPQLRIEVTANARSVFG